MQLFIRSAIGDLIGSHISILYINKKVLTGLQWDSNFAVSNFKFCGLSVHLNEIEFQFDNSALHYILRGPPINYQVLIRS